MPRNDETKGLESTELNKAKQNKQIRKSFENVFTATCVVNNEERTRTRSLCASVLDSPGDSSVPFTVTAADSAEDTVHFPDKLAKTQCSAWIPNPARQSTFHQLCLKQIIQPYWSRSHRLTKYPAVLLRLFDRLALILIQIGGQCAHLLTHLNVAAAGEEPTIALLGPPQRLSACKTTIL